MTWVPSVVLRLVSFIETFVLRYKDLSLNSGHTTDTGTGIPFSSSRLLQDSYL